MGTGQGEDGEKTVRFWDAATGKQAREIKGLASAPYSLALSPDGTQLAAIALKETPPRVLHEEPENHIQLWDVATGKEVRQLTVPVKETGLGKPGFRALAFSPDGKLLAAGGADEFLRV